MADDSRSIDITSGCRSGRRWPRRPTAYVNQLSAAALVTSVLARGKQIAIPNLIADNSIASDQERALWSPAVDDVAIEVEQPGDHAAISRVVRRAFADQPQVADMVAAIRMSPRYRSGLAFVARTGGQVVGFVMLSGTDLIDGADTRREILILTPLAVDPEFQRRGIGSALVAAAVDEADRRGEPLVVLEGSPHYYGRLGFEFAPAHGITIDLPDWAPPEAAQVHLLSGYDPRIRGRVEYPPAIAAVAG